MRKTRCSDDFQGYTAAKKITEALDPYAKARALQLESPDQRQLRLVKESLALQMETEAQTNRIEDAAKLTVEEIRNCLTECNRVYVDWLANLERIRLEREQREKIRALARIPALLMKTVLAEKQSSVALCIHDEKFRRRSD